MTKTTVVSCRLRDPELERLRLAAAEKNVQPAALIKELLVGSLSGRPKDPAKLKATAARASEIEKITEPFVYHAEASDKPFADPQLEQLRLRCRKLGVPPSAMIAAVLSGELDQSGEQADQVLKSVYGASAPYGAAKKADSKWGPIVDKVLADMATERVAKKAARTAVLDPERAFESPRIEKLRMACAISDPAILAGAILPAICSGGLSPELERSLGAKPIGIDELDELITRYQEANL